MRLLILTCAVLAISAVALGQNPAVRHNTGPYGYQPFVPLVTTPEVSLQTISPTPAGASNATYGLVAGARNSTLSMVNGNTSSVYTVPVWYSGGGAPLVSSPEVSLHTQELASEQARLAYRRGERPTARRAWTYFASLQEISSPAEVAQSAKGAKHAARTITNQDVEQENQKNGMVKYDGKTEQIK
ncbi:MAG: hypothetical protein JOZ14_10485 [Acidobacteria bacterium]|nr:hypothetical protein [Acidobacteriota bacterium]